MQAPITLLLIVSTVIFSWQGFRSAAFFARYKFLVHDIRSHHRYERVVTSGFLHANTQHLLLNMFSLYLFGEAVEHAIGSTVFILLYLTALIGGNLLALLIHRNHNDYAAIGASGAVYGVTYAYITLTPTTSLYFFGIGPGIPAWLFGLGYTLISIYGIRSQSDNIGHEAHLGGGIAGLLFILSLYPQLFITHYVYISLILVPALLFLYIIVSRPHLLLIDNLFYRKGQYHNIDERYNHKRALQEQELDELLDKINQKGIDNLSKKERERLEQLSK